MGGSDLRDSLRNWRRGGGEERRRGEGEERRGGKERMGEIKEERRK